MTKILRVARAFLLVSGAASAQQYTISTYAGGGPPSTPSPALSASLSPSALAADSGGNVYLAAPGAVFKLASNGVLTRFAGTSRPGYSGDGGPATSAQVEPQGLAVDAAGNLFIAEGIRIRKVALSGNIVTVAGNGITGFSGEGGPAVSARLSRASAVAADGAGNLFIADSGNSRIRKVTTDGLIATVAGGGSFAPGDGFQATSAYLFSPPTVAVDAAGNLFFTEFALNEGGYRIRKVAPNGTISTLARDPGNYSMALSLVADAKGNLFLTTSGNLSAGTVVKVTPDGVKTIVAGGGAADPGDGGSATSARLAQPFGVAVDGAGNLFLTDAGNSVLKVSTNGIISKVAGDGLAPFAGDGGAAASAQLADPVSVAVDSSGSLFLSDLGDQRVRLVSPGGMITTVAGTGAAGFSGDTGPAIDSQLNSPASVALDGAGNLFILDFGSNRVRRVSPSGVITTVAGTGTSGFSGDGGPATSAQLSLSCYAIFCAGLAVDSAGNLFVSDTGNDRVRKISADGTITTVAGSGEGTVQFGGDDGPATSAILALPTGLALDGAGNLFIADTYNGRIRMVSPKGIITTVAGGASAGPSGDGGPAASARLACPTGVAVDGGGNLFIADPGVTVSEADYWPGDSAVDHRIRRVSPNGTITTIAGGPSAGYSGDGGPATAAALNTPTGVAVDRAGNVYVADSFNHAVRVLRPTNHSVIIGAVVDAASQQVRPISPGKIVVIYGVGFGPAQLVQNQAVNGQFGTQIGGTTASVNGIAAPILYASATQVAAVVPYVVSGTTAQVTITYQGETSDPVSIPVALSSPSFFTLNQSGSGQAAAINAVDGTVNTAANPVKIGDYISLWATGEGQTSPAGVDGKVTGSTLPHPAQPWSATVGGVSAFVQYAGGAPGQIAGLMQVNVQIPSMVQPAGYVPVVLQVGNASTTPNAVWIAVAGK